MTVAMLHVTTKKKVNGKVPLSNSGAHTLADIKIIKISLSKNNVATIKNL